LTDQVTISRLKPALTVQAALDTATYEKGIKLGQPDEDPGAALDQAPRLPR
jgi:hypothetical protein